MRNRMGNRMRNRTLWSTMQAMQMKMDERKTNDELLNLENYFDLKLEQLKYSADAFMLKKNYVEVTVAR